MRHFQHLTRTRLPWIASLVGLSVLLVGARPSFALDVYIVAGQSNGYRLSSLSQAEGAKPDAHKVYYYGMKCVEEPVQSSFKVLTALSPGAMGYGLADALRELSDDDIIFIQYCRCGAGTWNKGETGWYPGDDPQNGQTHDAGLFGKFQKYIAHAQAQAEQEHGLEWNVRGLFWHQGESDSRFPAAQYEKNLANLVWRFRNLLGKELPVVAGHIRELNDGDRAINAVLDRLAAADPRMAVVNLDGLEFAPDRDGKPDVHIALSGCHTLGRRMAEAYQELAKQESTKETAKE